MNKLDTIRQVISWSFVFAYFVGLFTVIAWPRVKGKPWLIVSLTLLLVQGIYFRIFDYIVFFSDDKPKFDLYEKYQELGVAMFVLALIAQILLVVALFRLRSFLGSSEVVAITDSHQHKLSSAKIRTTWAVNGGSFIGAYRVRYNNAVVLAKNAALTLHDDNGLFLSSRYDPPGSAFFALLATIVSSYVVGTLAQLTGFAAAPGLLIWYVIFMLIRSRQVVFDLSRADSIIVDPDASRIAFRTKFDDRDRWFAIEVRSAFDDAYQALTAAAPDKTSEGSITNSSMRPLFLMIAFIIAMTAIIAFEIFRGMN